ncbi:response regulator [Streptomyces flavidovirens]|uniref:response regulator n=1 Tax=Streptomyces flavidovirens TaxID=67298 RepID=UPI0034183FCF
MRGEQREKRELDAWRTGLVDTALAAVIGGAVLLAAFTVSGPGPSTADVVLITAGSLALAVHRRAPVVSLVFTAACMLGYVVHANPRTSAAFPVIAGVHVVTRAGHRAAAVGVSVVFLVGFLLASPSGDGIERTLLLHGWFVCAGVTGLIDKNWQAYLRQTEQRAAEAERTREEAALRRAGEERLRIARELHDSLTHSISPARRRPRRHPARGSAPRRRLLRTRRTAAGGTVSDVNRVLIVDDQALMRAGFRALLAAEDDIEVVAEAADGRQGLELARRHVPDVALVDVQMPVMTGIETTQLVVFAYESGLVTPKGAQT